MDFDDYPYTLNEEDNIMNNKRTQGEAYGGELTHDGVYQRDNVSVLVPPFSEIGHEDPNTSGEDALREKGWTINKVTEQLYPSEVAEYIRNATISDEQLSDIREAVDTRMKDRYGNGYRVNNAIT